MKLRRKILLSAGGLFLASVTLSVLVSKRLLSGFAGLERDVVVRQVERLRDVLSDDAAGLEGAVKERAFRDDSYAFAGSGNPEDSHLADSTFQNLRLSFIAFVRPGGERFFEKAFGLEKGVETAVPEDWAAFTGPEGGPPGGAEPPSASGGILMLRGGPVLFSCAPILPSSQKGEARGTILFGRLLSEAEIGRVGRLVGLPVRIFRADDPDMPADVRSVFPGMLQADSPAVRALGKDLVAGYALVRDYRGLPAVIFKIESPRDIHRRGLLARRAILGAILAAGFASIALALILLNRLILSRLARMSEFFKKVRSSGDTSARLGEKGRDELAELGRSFDQMLETLEAFRRRDFALSVTDPLTGVFNRRHFVDRLREEIVRAKRYGRTLSLIILDLDHFKRFNDTLGHPAGDQLLRTTAAFLRGAVRQQDIITRLGGDEFAVLLPETDKASARALAERIRSGLESLPFALDGMTPAEAATISAGVGAFGEDGETGEILINRVDEALYRAKSAGRNRVVCA